MLLGILGTNLLGSMLSGEGAIRAGQNFNAASFFD